MDKESSPGFEITGPLQPDVEAALASGSAPFPSRDVELTEIRLEASTPKPIEFRHSRDKISFTAKAGRLSGFGVYRGGAVVLKKLGEGVEDFQLSAPEFESAEDSIFGVLRWGYAAEGNANGAMALAAAGKAALALSRESEGVFAVVRRLPASAPARQVVQSTADSWILPRQISSVEQVAPGTWIVAESIGGIRVRLTAHLSYRFHWVREVALRGLSGDIGLRLQTGINAAVGFSSAGRCAMVISRESDAKTLRLRLYRLGSRCLDIALDSKSSIQAVDKLLPARLDEFIAAVLGCHGQQILQDLRILEQWIDPAVPLSTFFVSAGLKGAEKLIADMAGIPADEVEKRFEKIHDTVVRFLVKWHDLPHKIAAVLLKLVGDKADLTEVRNLARRLSAITPDGLRLLLDVQISRLMFFSTPAGLLLEAASDKDVLSLLSRPIGYIQDLGRKLLAVLDGDAVEKVLQNFQHCMETELHLGQVMQAADEAGFDGMDAFLKNRLALFLGLDILAFPDLDKVRKAINLLLSRQQELYTKSLQALHRKHHFDMAAAYQSATSREALIDITFDFSRDSEAVSSLFRMAVEGRFEDLFGAPHPQIKIRAGKISHGIRRQAEIHISLPFLRASRTHLHESLAVMETAAADGELLFTLNATDTQAGNQRKSILSLLLNLPRGSGVRVHERAMGMNYTLLYAKRGMRRKHVLAQAGPTVKAYFKTAISSLDAFMDLIDRRTEEALPNGPDLLGDGLISLRVTLSESAGRAAGEAWLSLPSDRRSPVYRDMSIALQSSLKQRIHECYFTDPEKYRALETARTLLAYCALAPVCRISGDMPLWDSADAKNRRRMLGQAETVERMKGFLLLAQQALSGDAESQFYDPSDARKILDSIDERHWILDRLLRAESQLVRRGVEAGLRIGAFMAKKDAGPCDAVEALLAFGSALTEAFHESVTPLLGPGFQSLGTRIFLDVSRALNRKSREDLTETHAMLSLEFIRPDVRFDEASVLKSGMVPADQVAVSDRVIQ